MNLLIQTRNNSKDCYKIYHLLRSRRLITISIFQVETFLRVIVHSDKSWVKRVFSMYNVGRPLAPTSDRWWVAASTHHSFLLNLGPLSQKTFHLLLTRCWKHFYTHHSHSSKLLEIMCIIKLLTQCFNHSTTPIILTKVGDRLIRDVDYRIKTRNYASRWRAILWTRFPAKLSNTLNY